MDDDNRRRHGVEHGGQLLRPLAFTALTLAQRLFRPLALGDVAERGHPYAAPLIREGLPVRLDRDHDRRLS